MTALTISCRSTARLIKSFSQKWSTSHQANGVHKIITRSRMNLSWKTKSLNEDYDIPLTDFILKGPVHSLRFGLTRSIFISAAGTYVGFEAARIFAYVVAEMVDAFELDND